ncbi:hypothetical protein DID88_007842 [Monilinia fructigena]|uniref:Uncharacterized protein n=1 Tax=Monilinia fructigena TaxID=38457 RepID=A0A395J3L9_9HELO|nr:hypothetical protein DID88_007842 [Monilinia fructigena]
MRIYEYGYSIRTLGLLARATIKKWPIQKPRQLATAAPLHAERYDITCGISGKITVELYNSFLLRNSPSTPLVIYLPPCPTSPLLPLNPPSWLLSSYPILNIPYRWSHNPSIYHIVTQTLIHFQYHFTIHFTPTLGSWTVIFHLYPPSPDLWIHLSFNALKAYPKTPSNIWILPWWHSCHLSRPHRIPHLLPPTHKDPFPHSSQWNLRLDTHLNQTWPF